MDRRCHRRTDPPPTPSPNPSLLRDVSNYRTPIPKTPNPNPSPIFFTASKDTPTSSSLPRRRPSYISHPTAARRLKALELEQSRSARKTQLRKEKTLKSFARSITAWLNFLLEDPKACRCEVAGERRASKRQRSSVAEKGTEVVFGAEKASAAALGASLKEVCSFVDMRERMEGYVSRKGLDEVVLMMSRVCKNIDEGRLKMKAHCPIVTDLALKKKATKVLMCYNPTWLRIGLHIIFGGESLLNEGGKSCQDDPFMKMIIENQFFSHMDIARSYAYNKLVEGLYRPGYFEALGNIILKRFLLIVIFLDKAKCESSLPIEYGIDGIDGGSPLLFSRNSHIKSSRQAIHEFLSDSMHGEGDLLAHLAILGCKLHYQQPVISEYEFKIKILFEDLQDGVVLCRAIQLLKSDPSILPKVINPSDTRKKNLQNCNIALQYLKQASVPLSDDDKVPIVADDIVNGDRELSLSILWNMFVHLQVPLLVDKVTLVEEIVKIKGSDADLTSYNNDTEMDLLLTWIQAVCEKQYVKVCSFSSIIEGKAFSFLIDYYCGIQDQCDEGLIKHFDDAAAPVHKIAFVQSLTAMLGNFPEVFQLSDMLDEDACFDDRSVIILLVFLASQLIYKRNLDQLRQKIKQANCRNAIVKSLAIPQSPLSQICVFSNKKTRQKNVLTFVSPQEKIVSNKCLNQDNIRKIRLIQDWWRALRKRNSYIQTKSAACVIQRAVRYHLAKNNSREIRQELAASVVQSHFRGFTERKKFMKIKMAASLVQTAVRAWLTVTSTCKSNCLASSIQQTSNGTCNGYLRFMIERHGFVRIKRSTLLIQHAVRVCIAQRHHRAATRIQIAWERFTKRNLHLQKTSAAIKIQRYWRGWYFRKVFICQVAAVVEIQAGIRCLINQESFKRYSIAALEIQRLTRGHLVRKRLLGASNLRIDQLHGMTCNSLIKNSELKYVMHSILKLQRWWKKLLLIKSRTVTVILIQSSIRGWSARRKVNKRKHYISIIQRWWRNVLATKSRKESVTFIQAHVRGWIARRAVEREKHSIIIIQSYWKGYLARKYLGQQLADLRCTLQKSATNVDEDRKLLNRLVSALSELLDCKSISIIRHTCTTLDMATERSEKCCETLVAAGAIDILLKQFRWLNRGIPDQEILKHLISTLRNIVRYPSLLQALVDTPKAVDTILQELLRNKGDGFFIICELLKIICTTQEGLNAVRRSHGYVRRLYNLVHELERKIELQKKNARLCSGTDSKAQRLRVLTDLMSLILDDK